MASQHQFKRELSQLIRKYAEGLQTSDFSDVLGEFHHDLAQGSFTPKVEVESDLEPIKIRVTYSTAVALEHDLDDYLKVGGVCLDVDEELPALADVIVTVGGMHLDETVSLRGRVVRETAAGVAFQITAPDASIADILREMPERMRLAAAEAGHRALARAAEAAESEDGPAANGPNTGSAASDADGDASGQTGQQEQSDNSAQAGQPDRRAAASPQTTPSPIEVDAAPVRTWDLADDNVPSILRELLEHTGFGILDVTFGGRHAQLVLDGNLVVDVEIYPPAERESLAGLLSAAGKLNSAEIASAKRHVERHDVSMAEALVDLDVMTYAEIGVALQTRARFLLGVMWSRRQGRAKLYSVDELSRRFRAPRSPLAYHIFRRMRDKLRGSSREWLDERREFFRAHLISRAEAPVCSSKALDLSSKHERFYELVLETPRPLSEVLRISQLGEQETLIFLECLRQIGMLDIEETNPWTRRRTKFIQQLTRMQARMHGQNHFELLGVHWTAHRVEIDSAYQERKESLSSEKLPDNLDTESRELVEVLRQKIDDAYELLCDKRRRRQYRDEIVDSFEKKTALEMFVDQADTAKLRRDLDGAIDAYRRVVELAPSHAQAKKDLKVLEKLRAAEQQQ